MNTIAERIAASLGLDAAAVAATLALFDDGATVPFVARYRKERTGGLDEEQLRAVRSESTRLMELDSRRESILAGMRERGQLTAALEAAIAAAETRSALEDIYSPYRPRRTTRADRARDAGCGPVAEAFLRDRTTPLATLLPEHCPDGLDRTACVDGLVDIVAAETAADPAVRAAVYGTFQRQAALRSERARGASEEAVATYRDYLDWKEPVRGAKSHRVLAVLRGVRDGALRVTMRPPQPAALRVLQQHLAADGPTAADRREVEDRIVGESWDRLLAPTLEKRLAKEVRERAEAAATEVFAAGLRDILLAPPFGTRPVLAIDPGFRSGCKVVALDGTGRLRAHRTVRPLPPHGDRRGAGTVIRDMVTAHGPEAIAVGNGTGGRETEEFLRELAPGVPIVRVSEAGASVYSASPAARQEFPDLAVEYRGAVSIGRRLQDPLAELVKIDPASVGVGQYQHDIDAGRLERAVNDTVETCVNTVGVEVNTASEALLARVAGLDARTARAIVAHRDRHGPFARRDAVRTVEGIGPRRWQQCAGFLRCHASPDRRDHTGVHPERYGLVDRMAEAVGVSPGDLVGNGPALDTLTAMDPAQWLDQEAGVGVPTIHDVIAELRRGGVDTRGAFSAPEFAEGIRTIDDLREGMVLDGTVTNITAFGAFVDVGVHRDGLVHVSAMADRYVSDPHTVVRVGQTVRATVTEVDRDRGRISLSMRTAAPE